MAPTRRRPSVPSRKAPSAQPSLLDLPNSHNGTVLVKDHGATPVAHDIGHALGARAHCFGTACGNHSAGGDGEDRVHIRNVSDFAPDTADEANQ